MQESVIERLKIAVKEITNGNLKEFAKQADIPYRTFQSYISGEREPGANNLSKISARLCISLDWLLTGDGEMFRQERGDHYNNVTEVTRLIVQVLQDMPEDQQRDVLKYCEEKKLLRELMEERKGKKNAG
jgi:phage repressor protein C with HTH and peptisase S24 domain